MASTLQVNPQLLNPEAAATQHDQNITSVSLDQGAPRHLRLVQKGELDYELVQDFLEHLLDTEGEDIFRMKGVLAVAHAERKYVYHAVHMTFSGDWAEPWQPGESRESKMVFIGKGLDEKFLVSTFNKCLATPENLQRKASTLRYTLGDEVECRRGDGVWYAGVVVGLLIRNAAMADGVVAPYQVKLDNGSVILMSKDCDSVIRGAVHYDESVSEEDDEFEDKGGHAPPRADAMSVFRASQGAACVLDRHTRGCQKCAGACTREHQVVGVSRQGGACVGS